MPSQLRSNRQCSTHQSRQAATTSIYVKYGWGGVLPKRMGSAALCAFLFVGCQRTALERDDSNTPASKTTAAPKQTPPASPEQAALSSKHQSKSLEKLGNSDVSTTSIQPHPQTGDFNDLQLGKAHTLVVLALDSVTRQKYFLYNYYSKLTPTQVERARDLIDSYELDFARLRDQRAAILETARDGQGVDVLLKNNRIQTVLLSRQVRIEINREIMTKEQRQKSQAEAKAQQEAKQQRDQSKK